MGFAIADVCGTVMCVEDVTSLPFFWRLAFSSFWERSLLGSLGSLGVGVQRSGCAIWASRVSNGKREAFGRPANGRIYQHHSLLCR